MLTALKKFARGSDDRCPAPTPMSSSFQKKFSRGVHFNMKILIKGDRNVGKSCLLQRLQGGQFIEEYVPTDQIQVAPIHWKYKNTDYIVKVEVWEVVDKGRTKKKPPLGLKLENQSTVPIQEDETPVLDATFLDVYKNASGVILMFDITKPWTFEYVVKELSQVPADLPVVVLGNHCDMQHHRQVHPHHIDHVLHQAKLTRSAPVRYAESSMRNGFGLRLLHKFLSVPFLRLQKTSLLEQLQRNQKDIEDTETDLDDFQNSEESHYNLFVDRLANKRKETESQSETRTNTDRSPSIVLGAGKPIIPHNVNPLLTQSLNLASKPPKPEVIETQYVNTDLLKQAHPVAIEQLQQSHSNSNIIITPSVVTVQSGTLDEFYAGTLDSSFLEDLTPLTTNNPEIFHESESFDFSDDDITTNPRVNIYQDDLDIDIALNGQGISQKNMPENIHYTRENDYTANKLDRLSIRCRRSEEVVTADGDNVNIFVHERTLGIVPPIDNLFPLWTTDSSTRRSPEGGEDPDVVIKDSGDQKGEKKHKKKKSKEKDRGDFSDKSDRKEKKHKHKKTKNDKKPTNVQSDLLLPSHTPEFNYEEYDSI